jgi:hypothetical protein
VHCCDLSLWLPTLDSERASIDRTYAQPIKRPPPAFPTISAHWTLDIGPLAAQVSTTLSGAAVMSFKISELQNPDDEIVCCRLVFTGKAFFRGCKARSVASLSTKAAAWYLQHKYRTQSAVRFLFVCQFITKSYPCAALNQVQSPQPRRSNLFGSVQGLECASLTYLLNSR